MRGHRQNKLYSLSFKPAFDAGSIVRRRELDVGDSGGNEVSEFARGSETGLVQAHPFDLPAWKNGNGEIS